METFGFCVLFVFWAFPALFAERGTCLCLIYDGSCQGHSRSRAGPPPAPGAALGPRGVHLLLWARELPALTPPVPAGKESFPSSSLLFPLLFLFNSPSFLFPLEHRLTASAPRSVRYGNSPACVGVLWMLRSSPSGAISRLHEPINEKLSSSGVNNFLH